MNSEVLNLLVAGDDPPSENEAFLASSILHATQCPNSEGSKIVEVLSSRASEDDLSLSLLVEAIPTCPAPTLRQNFTQWTRLLMGKMQVAFRGMSSLLQCMSEAGHDLGAQSRLPLLHSLLSLSLATPPLQAMALRLVAHCLVHFTSSCSQDRPALRKWVGSATFSSHLPLSQEGSRILVLLCRHSNQQWSSLLESVVCGVEWVLNQLYQQTKTSATAKAGHDGFPSGVSSWLTPPPPPKTDPDRTASLLQLLHQLTRTLCYSLLFSPHDPAHPPPVPLHRILTLVSHGLKPAPAGHTVEALVLRAALPVVHNAMWNTACVLIRTCHTHLLPYTADVTSLLTTALCSKENQRSPVLLATVHKTLETWVGMSRDYDTPFMTPVLRSLLNSSNHTHLRHSSLKALSTLVSFIGPLVPPPLASSILQLCLEGLTPCPPCEETLVLLRLLMACVFSGNTHLAPPTNAAIQLLTDLVNQHTSREVANLSLSALSQFSLRTYLQQVTPPSCIPSQPSTNCSSSHQAPPTSSALSQVPPTSSALPQAPPTTSSALPQAPPTTSSALSQAPPISSALSQAPPTSIVLSPSTSVLSDNPSEPIQSQRNPKRKVSSESGESAATSGRKRMMRSSSGIREGVMSGGLPREVSVGGGFPGDVSMGRGKERVGGGLARKVKIGRVLSGEVGADGALSGDVERDLVTEILDSSDSETSGMEYFVADSPDN